jgi:hypothetical protein
MPLVRLTKLADWPLKGAVRSRSGRLEAIRGCSNGFRRIPPQYLTSRRVMGLIRIVSVRTSPVCFCRGPELRFFDSRSSRRKQEGHPEPATETMGAGVGRVDPIAHAADNADRLSLNFNNLGN